MNAHQKTISIFVLKYLHLREKNHDRIQNYYEPFGFMDCYMVVYYMLCGKDYYVNPYMTDTHHHRNDGFDWDGFVESRNPVIEIINNYKKYYWV